MNAQSKIIATGVAMIIAIAGLSGCSSPDHSAATAQTSTAGPAKTAAAPAKPAGPKATVAQQQALISAKSYIDNIGGFSYAGLLEQLTSSAGEGFNKADAVWAINQLHPNWNEQAVMSAKSYLKMGGFSRASLIEQLSSASGEQFTKAQAIYAANKVGLK